MMPNMIQYTMIPMVVPIANWYGLTSTTLVNLCCFINFITAPFMTYFVIGLLQRYSLYMLLRFAVTLQFIGSMLRMYTFVNGEFWPILLGHFICALTGPFCFVSCTIFTTNWFNEKERATATAIVTTGASLGTGITFAIDMHYTSLPELNINEALYEIMSVQNIMFLAVWLGFLIFFKEKPERPPSAAAEAPVQMVNFFDIFDVIKNNSNFTILAIIFALKQATLTAFGGLMSDVLSPFGYTASQIAQLGVIFFVCGVTGAILVTIVLDKTHAFKYTLVTLTAAIAATIIQVTFFID